MTYNYKCLSRLQSQTGPIYNVVPNYYNRVAVNSVNTLLPVSKTHAHCVTSHIFDTNEKEALWCASMVQKYSGFYWFVITQSNPSGAVKNGVWFKKNKAQP